MSDWSALGGDPAPGHPLGIRRLATTIGGTATRAAEGQHELVGIASMSGEIPWKGESAKAFEGAFEKLTPALGRMARSYERVAEALELYGTRVENLHNRALTQLARAQDAERRAAAARAALAQAEAETARARSEEQGAEASERAASSRYNADAAAGSPTAQASYDSYVNANRRRNEASARVSSANATKRRHEAELSQARHDLKEARDKAHIIREQYRACGRTCASHIDEALDEHLENHRFRHWLGKAKDGVVYTAKIPFWVVEGAAESVYSMGKMLGGLTLEFIWNPTGAIDNWKALGTAAKWGYHHPGEMFTTVMNVEGFLDNPAKWAGGFAPDVIAALYTGGGAAALRGARGVAMAEDMSKVNRIARAADAATPSELGPHGPIRPWGFDDAFKGSDIAVHSGPAPHDMYLVQVAKVDKYGNTITGSWWTPLGQANGFTSMKDLQKQLALMPRFGKNTRIQVAHIPAGSPIEYRAGTAASQVIKAPKDFPVIYRPGGAAQIQVQPKLLNPAYILGDTAITSPSKAGWVPIAGGGSYIGADGGRRVLQHDAR